jgi:glycosyltransferase involved in cell wall biosynthesis
MDMRVLHLFSNSKWTGPAEPALSLAVHLRDLGLDVSFACAPYCANPVNRVVESAREQGLEPVLTLRLYKHRHPVWNLTDAWRLARLVRAGRFDIVHCHLDNDHRIAITALARSRAVYGAPVLVRSSYHGAGFPVRLGTAFAIGRTDALLEPSLRALERDRASFGERIRFIQRVATGVDAQRFDPSRPLPDLRENLGLGPADVLLGIVARVQPHRKFDVLLEAFARVARQEPHAHLVIVGRGSKMERVVVEPVRRMGLSHRVHFAGFLQGDDYAAALKSFDIGVLLAPGSDETCRAAREMMAMGLPMVVSDAGMLPEIVDHGTNGCVCSCTPGELAEAFRGLVQNGELRRQMGAAARSKALREFSLRRQARAVADVYERLLSFRRAHLN